MIPSKEEKEYYLTGYQAMLIYFAIKKAYRNCEGRDKDECLKIVEKLGYNKDELMDEWKFRGC